MHINIWRDHKKPFLVLAPMADVTDVAFRSIIAEYGKPDVFWTEFVSADGLYHTREIQKINDADNPLMKDLQYTPQERPIIAQIFSSKPDMIEYASNLIVDLGFDGVDINMGCPHRTVIKQGAGAALIKNHKLARELIRSAKKGVADRIPVSVKTRIGYTKNELHSWLPNILAEKPALVTVHARTKKELSEVPARFEHIKEAVDIRNTIDPEKNILIFGNGDIKSISEASEKILETGADGVMIGRGIFGNPWFFSEHAPSVTERFCALEKHCQYFTLFCAHKNFSIMKKHFKSYITGFDNAKEIRTLLLSCNSSEEVTDILKQINHGLHF